MSNTATTTNTHQAGLRKAHDAAVQQRREAVRNGNQQSIAQAIAAEKAASAAVRNAR